MAIISVTLSAGARPMSVALIVRRLEAIENLGSMAIPVHRQDRYADRGHHRSQRCIGRGELAIDHVLAVCLSMLVLESLALKVRSMQRSSSPAENAGLTTQGFAKIDEIP